MFAGRAVGGVPAGETAEVGGLTAVALPAAEVAVTTTLSACPTSVLTGLYFPAVAPVIAAHCAPAASQRLHAYENLSGLPPSQIPGTAASSSPASAKPTMVGGSERRGRPVGYGSMATAVRFVPFIRSPSVHFLLMPGTETQFVHCQKRQPNPLQFWAGTKGWPALVQCAIQSAVPAAATAVELPRWERQKSGEV